MKAPTFRRSAIAVAISATFASQLTTASTPLGGEFLVNDAHFAGVQQDASVARAADGRFVIVWTDHDGTDGSGAGIKARLYGADGSPSGSEFVVNEGTAGTQRLPDVAMEPDGDFVVVWQSNYSEADGFFTYGIVARRFTAAGTASTADIKVNHVSANNQLFPAVATDADGDFVVAWQSYNQAPDAASYGIFARRFNAAGTALGTNFKVNGTTVGPQLDPDVGMDAAGNIVVSWKSSDGSGYGVFTRRYDSTGAALGGEMLVNGTTAANQDQAAVAVDADGDYVVAWRGYMGAPVSAYAIAARRYNAAGIAQGGEFQVDQSAVAVQVPSIAIDADGDFAVAWQSNSIDGDAYSVSLRRFNAAGAVQTSELLVNVYTSSYQWKPAIAMDADGDLVVAWPSYGQAAPQLPNSASYDIYARRYNGGEDVDLSIASSGPATRTPGQTITYTITGTNEHAVSSTTGIAAIDTAIGAASGVVVSSQLDADSEFLSATGSNWTCDNAGNDVTCTYDLLLGAQATTSALTVRAFGPETQAGDTLVNATSIDADQDDGTPANDDDDVTTTIACNRGTISLTWVNASVDESVGSTGIAVSRHDGSCGAASVSFATSNGTATAGVDYTDADQTVNWSAGEAGTKFIAVPIAGNATDEADETVNITLSGATGATLGSPASAVLTILDDDNPVVNFTSAGQTVNENVGLVTLTATTTVVSDVNLVLTLNRTGTANAADLSGVPTTLTILAGATSASTTFSVVNDTRYEPAGNTAIFTITKVTARATRGATKVHTVTIDDNDPQPVLSFERAQDLDVGEGAVRTVRIQLDRESDETISVPYGPTVGSTATQNVDYTLGLGSPVVFAPGITSKALTVRSINDTDTEGAETAILQLTAPANVTPGANMTYTFEIRASD